MRRTEGTFLSLVPQLPWFKSTSATQERKEGLHLVGVRSGPPNLAVLRWGAEASLAVVAP